MNVIRAHSAGFCMGVALALQKLDTIVGQVTDQGKDCHQRICTFGPIIHNPQVLMHYENQGVTCLKNIQDAKNKDIIVIRAHGIPKEEEQSLGEKASRIIDATCPKVKKAQLAIAKATQNGATLLLFGECNHPEVRGLISYACHEALVFDSLKELQAIKLLPQQNYVLASQTTQDQELFLEIECYLREKLHTMPVLATICNATKKRQEEAMEIALNVQGMVIVGGKESGNTRRLADVAASKGVPTWHVESVTELCPEFFSNIQNIGLTAGASTPKELIDEVHDFLKAI